MTPAARLQAAIDLIRGQDETGRAPDRLLASWAKGNRYAGSKDRRAVSELYYDILRHRMALEWRLLQAGLVHSTPRLLAFAQIGWAEAERLAGQGIHGPSEITANERGILQQLPAMDAAMPLWARHNFASWLEPYLVRSLGIEIETELAVLGKRAPVDLRVNQMRARPTDIIERLKRIGLHAEPLPLAPYGVRLPPGTYDLRDFAGFVEPQDEAAQIAAHLVDARAGQSIIDLCAGGGGKTLALIDLIQDSGALHAFDIDSRRLARLRKRAEIYQSHALNIHDADRHSALDALKGQADRVLVDAPCSGTGVWRRHPTAGYRLTPAQFERDRTAQAQLLDLARELARPGGRIIYATCSLLREENEDQIAAFLARAPDMRLLPIHDVWQTVLGDPSPADKPMLRLTPANHGCDGFFVALLEKI